MYYIVYNADTLVLVGLTQNCYERFGLPSSIVYGLSSKSFTINNIIIIWNDSFEILIFFIILLDIIDEY